ncbi:hypothetical protein [uncultured Spirosoma sp.]|uniref:hypothetical protein n=1 Tax=uncultured Spirosoma sp. TaxID=278208 RepID=UPI0025840B6A|nr:hypothetical protein [uncultured Spirosoma sp.]
MKTFFTLGLVVSLGLIGCNNKPAVNPQEDVEALYQRFHGKYRVVSSTSSEPLDINFDGASSTNLLKEIVELTNYDAFLELRVKYPDRSVFLFTQFWPEQYVNSYTGLDQQWNGFDTLSYNATRSVHYAQQGVPYSFSFTPDLSQILVTANDKASKIRWVKPESVFIEEKDRLRLRNKRRVYTRTGVKEVIITTIYERFTMTT